MTGTNLSEAERAACAAVDAWLASTGWSQSKLAAACGCSAAAISRVRRATQPVGRALALAIEKATTGAMLRGEVSVSPLAADALRAPSRVHARRAA